MTLQVLIKNFPVQVIQRRGSFGRGHINFTKLWTEYKDGFGDLDMWPESEFWYGNEFLHKLTYNTTATLRVDLVAHDGSTAFAEYSEFR